MLVKPKPYTPTQRGGYLLNDSTHYENLIIDKSRYRDFSVILENNIIYDMVNKLSFTPLKINVNVL